MYILTINIYILTINIYTYYKCIYLLETYILTINVYTYYKCIYLRLYQPYLVSEKELETCSIEANSYSSTYPCDQSIESSHGIGALELWTHNFVQLE